MCGVPWVERTRTMAVACVGANRKRASLARIPASPRGISGSALPGGAAARVHSRAEISVRARFLLPPGHAGLSSGDPPVPRRSSIAKAACCFTVPHLIVADSRAHGVQPRNTMRGESGQTAGLTAPAHQNTVQAQAKQLRQRLSMPSLAALPTPETLTALEVSPLTCSRKHSSSKS
jgi:hypothetical protein